MTHTTRRGLAAVALLMAAAFPLARAPLADDPPAPPTPADRLAGMTWLAGAWSGPMWGGTFRTYYSTPEGGRILSHSQLVKDGKVAFHEFELFTVTADAVVLVPHPGGVPAAEFRLAAFDAAAKSATFDSPKNDFPTRIVYHRVADDRLVITLSDPHGASGKLETFDLARDPPPK